MQLMFILNFNDDYWYVMIVKLCNVKEKFEDTKGVIRSIKEVFYTHVKFIDTTVLSTFLPRIL